MRLRPLPFREIKRKLQAAGFIVVSQKGSHVKFIKEIPGRRLIVIVPEHSLVKKGTLNGIIKQAEMNLPDFEKL